MSILSRFNPKLRKRETGTRQYDGWDNRRENFFSVSGSLPLSGFSINTYTLRDVCRMLQIFKVHPNVVRIRQSFVEDGTHPIIFRTSEGRSKGVEVLVVSKEGGREVVGPLSVKKILPSFTGFIEDPGPLPSRLVTR